MSPLSTFATNQPFQDQVQSFVDTFGITSDPINQDQDGFTIHCENNIETDYFYFASKDLGKLDKLPTRSELAKISREFNKQFAVFFIIIFRYQVQDTNLKNTNYITFSVCQSHSKKLGSDMGRNVVNKIIMLKDINLSDTHPAHIQIVETLKTKVDTLDQLKNHWLNVLSKDKLNKDFYGDIVGFYERLINDQSNVINPYNDKNHTQKGAVRLLLRVLFIWFLEQKKEVILTNDNQSITQWLTNEPKHTQFLKIINIP